MSIRIRHLRLPLELRYLVVSPRRSLPRAEALVRAEDGLRPQLDVSSRAMTEAQDLARGAAQQLDERTGTEAAVLGLEASQHAWEAYRDVECQTIALFVGAGAPVETAQLACEIRLTRARTDSMLRLAHPGD